MFKFITCILLLTSIHAEDIETDKVTIATISSKEGECKHTVTQGDRVYLFFSGIEHNSGQVFDTNRGLGSNAFIMRVGEPNVLPGKNLTVCHLFFFSWNFHHKFNQRKP